MLGQVLSKFFALILMLEFLRMQRILNLKATKKFRCPITPDLKGILSSSLLFTSYGWTSRITKVHRRKNTLLQVSPSKMPNQIQTPCVFRVTLDICGSPAAPAAMLKENSPPEMLSLTCYIFPLHLVWIPGDCLCWNFSCFLKVPSCILVLESRRQKRRQPACFG